MKHARPSSDVKPQGQDARSEGSNPSPSTNTDTSSAARPMSDTIEARQPGEDPLVSANHLWVLDGQLVIRGMVVTGKECTELPWRRKKDGEPASQAEIARDIELVKALYIRSKVQTPSDFGDTKLYIREDVK